MTGLDKYPDCPCYNCIVRSTCKIPSMIIITSVTSNNNNQVFRAHLSTCKCFLLHKYLEKMDKDDQVGFLLNIRKIVIVLPRNIIIDKFADRGAE